LPNLRPDGELRGFLGCPFFRCNQPFLFFIPTLTGDSKPGTSLGITLDASGLPTI
jgi:hypothetical protein